MEAAASASVRAVRLVGYLRWLGLGKGRSPAAIRRRDRVAGFPWFSTTILRKLRMAGFCANST
jgi:hypothetical protein